MTSISIILFIAIPALQLSITHSENPNFLTKRLICNTQAKFEVWLLSAQTACLDSQDI